MASQTHQTSLHVCHQFGVQILIATVNDGCQCFEGDSDNIEIIIVAIVENAYHASDDSFLVCLSACEFIYLKLLSAMRFERTPRQ